MATTVQVQDQLNISDVGRLFTVNVPAKSITVRQLIQSRVEQEVNAYNEQKSPIFQGLIQPTDTEVTLNGFRRTSRRAVDAQAQVAKAIEAFETNGFILLLDDLQVTNLEQRIDIRPQTTVTFLKLVPLVGG